MHMQDKKNREKLLVLRSFCDAPEAPEPPEAPEDPSDRSFLSFLFGKKSKGTPPTFIPSPTPTAFFSSFIIPTATDDTILPAHEAPLRSLARSTVAWQVKPRKPITRGMKPTVEEGPAPHGYTIALCDPFRRHKQTVLNRLVLGNRGINFPLRVSVSLQSRCIHIAGTWSRFTVAWSAVDLCKA